ncbi:MAG: high-potential iron-sulfur protein [Aquabacterium sp.]
MSERRCMNCEFWNLDDGADWGECHRFPPTTAMGNPGDWYTSWPQVDVEDGCGEFKESQET